MQINKVAIIFISLLVLGASISSFGMDQKRIGEKRKRSPESADQGNQKKKRKKQIGEEPSDDEQKEEQAKEKKEQETCVICLFNLHDDSQESGGIKTLINCPHDPHTFHKKCIDQWFETKNTCPLCREPEFCFVCKKIFTDKDLKKERQPCGHVFHDACYNRHIKERCPVCTPIRPQLPEQNRALTSSSDQFRVTIQGNIANVTDLRQDATETQLQLQQRGKLGLKVFGDMAVLLYMDNELEVFNLHTQQKKTIPLQQTIIGNIVFRNKRFLIIVYANNTYDAFDRQTSFERVHLRISRQLIVRLHENTAQVFQNNSSNPTKIILLRKDKKILKTHIYGPVVAFFYEGGICDALDARNDFKSLPLQSNVKNIHLRGPFLIVVYNNGKSDVFDLVNNNKKYTLQLQFKEIKEPFLTLNNRFFQVEYADGRRDIFDAAKNFSKLPVQDKVVKIALLRGAFFIVVYSDNETEVFDLLNNNKKYTLQLQPKDVVAYFLLNDNRFLHFVYADGRRDICDATKNFSKLPVQDKAIKNSIYKGGSFYIVVYSDNETEVFDLDKNYQRRILPINNIAIDSRCIVQQRFLVAFYVYNSADEAEVFDLANNNKKYTLSLQNEPVLDWVVKNDRYLVVYYKSDPEDTENDCPDYEIDIFDTQDNCKKYTVELGDEDAGVEEELIKDDRFFIIIYDGCTKIEIIDFKDNNKTYEVYPDGPCTVLGITENKFIELEYGTDDIKRINFKEN